MFRVGLFKMYRKISKKKKKRECLISGSGGDRGEKQVAQVRKHDHSLL